MPRPLRFLLPLLGLLLALTAARPAAAGYTHYWRWHIPPDPAVVARCSEDMSRIAEARRGILSDFKGHTGSAAVFRVVLPAEDGGAPYPWIAFNGIGDDGNELFGFPFAKLMPEDDLFHFVKTASKPYDEVVTACLLAARDCFARDVLAINSDGAWPADWAPGAALYEKVLGRKAKNPLDPPGEVLPPGITTSTATAGPSTASADGKGTAHDGTSVVLREEHPSPRKKVLLGVIVLLALAIAFVLTREGR